MYKRLHGEPLAQLPRQPCLAGVEDRIAVGSLVGEANRVADQAPVFRRQGRPGKRPVRRALHVQPRSLGAHVTEFQRPGLAQILLQGEVPRLRVSRPCNTGRLRCCC